MSAAEVGSSMTDIKRLAPRSPAVRGAAVLQPPSGRTPSTPPTGRTPGAIARAHQAARRAPAPWAAQAPPQANIALEVVKNANRLFKPRHPQMTEVEFKDLAGKTLAVHGKTSLAFYLEHRMFKY